MTPTNKSKINFEHRAKKECTTIHSLLGLRPNLDILEFDASQLSFEFVVNVNWNVDIILLDECSMINDQLYSTLLDKAEHFKFKIIFSGDEKQLAPVKQSYISRTFSDNKVISLEKVYRQKDSILYKVLDYLRKKPIYKFKSIEDENGSILVYSNIQQMLKERCQLFKVAQNFNDSSLVKLITYTNNRISALNQYIRKLLYKDDREYHIGEVLTGYDNCSINSGNIFNSEDYVVESCIEGVVMDCKGWYLTLSDLNHNKLKVRILSRDNDSSDFEKIATKSELLRVKALKSKNKKDWKKYYEFNDSFLTPVDLVYKGRIVRRKSLDYGYCISAHKSQSSTYQIVLIDMENIFRCTNPEELRQMQYVALSRTAGEIIIYQKNEENTV